MTVTGKSRNIQHPVEETELNKTYKSNNTRGQLINFFHFYHYRTLGIGPPYKDHPSSVVVTLQSCWPSSRSLGLIGNPYLGRIKEPNERQGAEIFHRFIAFQWIHPNVPLAIGLGLCRCCPSVHQRTPSVSCYISSTILHSVLVYETSPNKNHECSASIQRASLSSPSIRPSIECSWTGVLLLQFVIGDFYACTALWAVLLYCGWCLLPATVMLAVSCTTWNSGASPEISQR